MNPFPSDKILKRMGYFDDQEGIINRYINEESNWLSHLSKTKEFIIRSVQKIQPENIAVLGSGWLLDVPYEFLAGNCKNVFLYDIRHPRQIVHKLKKYRNINLINYDITGGAIEEVYTIMNSSNPTVTSLNEIEIPGFVLNEPIDYIVSVNILNQLDNLILEYIRKFAFPDKSAIEILQRNIQLAHISSLLKSNSCLITDYEELLYDRTGKLVSANPLLFCNLPSANYTKEWLWNFDTQMTYYPNRTTIFKVIALQL